MTKPCTGNERLWVWVPPDLHKRLLDTVYALQQLDESVTLSSVAAEALEQRVGDLERHVAAVYAGAPPPARPVGEGVRAGRPRKPRGEEVGSSS